MATARLVPALPDDPIEEILLRFPPDNPARLIRAALVCKGWRRLISSTEFRHRFREFHRAPLMLGFLRPDGRFQSTTLFRPRYVSDGNGVQIRRPLGARHGRVLLNSYSPCGSKRRHDNVDLVVWDPVRGDLQTLPPLLHHWCCDRWTAAVVCVAAGCDHLDCARGPFYVAFVGAQGMLWFVTSVFVYSSEVGAWSELHEAALLPPPNAPRPINLGQGALVGNVLYFRCSTGILEHDLGTQVSKVIRPPKFFKHDHNAVLMTTEEGNLGLANIQQSKLVLWSREVHLGSGGEYAGWAQNRAIELGAFLPVNALLDSAQLDRFADGIAVILVQIVHRELFTIDIKSNRVNKI